MLQCVAVDSAVCTPRYKPADSCSLRCSVLQCGAVCCSVLQLMWLNAYPDTNQPIIPAGCCGACALQCGAVCCSVLQCVAVDLVVCISSYKAAHYFCRLLWRMCVGVQENMNER